GARRRARGRATGGRREAAPRAAPPPSRGERRGARDGCARGGGARGSRRRARRGGRSTAARVPQGEARVVARVGVAEGAALFGAGELASGIELDERAHETAEVPAPRGRSPAYVSRTRRAARPPRRHMRTTAGAPSPTRIR